MKLHELVKIGEAIGLDAEWFGTVEERIEEGKGHDVAFVTAVEGDREAPRGQGDEWENTQLAKLTNLIPESLFNFELNVSEQTGRPVLFASCLESEQYVLKQTREHILQWALSQYYSNCIDDSDNVEY